MLDAVGAEFDYEEHPFGGASIDAHGTALTDETLAACRAADAVLLAAVGGPKWDTTDPAQPRPEQGLLGLRKGLGLFANLRPVARCRRCTTPARSSPRSSRAPTCWSCASSPAGSTSARRPRTDDRASDACVYTREEIERIARVGVRRRPRSRVTSVDKANVLETSRLWREVVRDVHARGVPQRRARAPARRQRRDAAVAAPRHFDVILTENMFGDILSDEAAMLTGSIGMLPSASLGGEGGPGPVRARPRLGARHRRHRRRQPAGDVPVRGADAAPRTRLWKPRRRR